MLPDDDCTVGAFPSVTLEMRNRMRNTEFGLFVSSRFFYTLYAFSFVTAQRWIGLLARPELYSVFELDFVSRCVIVRVFRLYEVYLTLRVRK